MRATSVSDAFSFAVSSLCHTSHTSYTYTHSKARVEMAKSRDIASVGTESWGGGDYGSGGFGGVGGCGAAAALLHLHLHLLVSFFPDAKMLLACCRLERI